MALAKNGEIHHKKSPFYAIATPVGPWMCERVFLYICVVESVFQGILPVFMLLLLGYEVIPKTDLNNPVSRQVVLGRRWR